MTQHKSLIHKAGLARNHISIIMIQLSAHHNEIIYVKANFEEGRQVKQNNRTNAIQMFSPARTYCSPFTAQCI